MTSEGTSTSSDQERMDATVSAVNILAQGKRNMVCGEVPTAVNQFQEACKILSKAYGETAKECADAYFCYGQALLDLARMETGVLGNALQGVPDTDDENVEQKDDQFEKPDLEVEEREKLRIEVYDAMSEKETEKKDKAPEGEKAVGETMEVSGPDDKDKRKTPDDKKEDGETAEKKLETSVTEEKDSKECKKDEMKDEKDEKEEKPKDKKPESEGMDTDEKKDGDSDEKSSEKKDSSEVKDRDDIRKDVVDAMSEKETDKKPDSKTSEMETEEEAKPKSEGDEKEPEMKVEESEKKEDKDKEKDAEMEDGEKKDEDGEEGEESAEDGEGEGTEEEEGEDTAEDAGSQDGSQDGENADDISNLQLAWEMLELAKLVYSKDESKEAKMRVAESHLKLGEVSLETEQYEEAIKDFSICLKMQQELLEPDNRLLAETHYQLGLSYCFNKLFTESADSYNAAIKVIESRIANLNVILDKATDEEKETKDFDSPVYKAKNEVQDLEKLVPDIKAKIEDCEDERKNMDALRNLAKEALGGSSLSSSSTTEPAPKTNTPQEEVKTTDISHLIKRKRKSGEEMEEESVKKARQETGTGDASDTKVNGDTAKVNGHMEKMDEGPSEETKKTEATA